MKKYEIFEKTITNDHNKELLAGEAAFVHESGEKVTTILFRTGAQSFMARFMPYLEGKWSYSIVLDGYEDAGQFVCEEPASKVHGRVFTEEYHFKYEDGTNYIPFGTTSYAWINQPQELQEETLETLKKAPFNKIRMGIFPKSMPYNNNEPDYFPFRKREDGTWNPGDIVPEFWDNLDYRMKQLMELNIVSDLILFHPYDRWGFAAMSQEDSLLYLRYVIARYSAFRNIWWSLANEYEMLTKKSIDDWDTYGGLLQKEDCYRHPISIHQIIHIFPKRDWMTHMSIQTKDIDHIIFWRQEYQLPIIIDECGYEGNLEFDWGNLSAREMTHRFWWTLCRGAYCTHGETFHRDDEILWWAKGGKLYGESPEQIAFARQIFEELPGTYQVKTMRFMNPNEDKAILDQIDNAFVKTFCTVISQADLNEQWFLIADQSPLTIENEDFSLKYLGRTCPRQVQIELDESKKYTVEVLDIWEMTRKVVMTDVSGKVSVPLPAKEGQVVYAHVKEKNTGKQ